MESTKHIKIKDEQILDEVKTPHLLFDDPPSWSPARWYAPAFDLDQTRKLLHASLENSTSYVEAGGVFSGGKSGEYVSFVWIALGVLGSGVLSAIGKDIWDVLKKAFKKLVLTNRGQRNVVEVGIEFADLDVILHYESRDSSKILDMFEDADSIIGEVEELISRNKDFVGKAKTIELHRQADGTYFCVLYSYRKCRKMLQTKISKKSHKEEH